MTDKAIDVSVVIPTCRRVVHVREAIDSALNQQGVTLEVIVVDDDPAGSARVCIDAVDDSRLRYLVRQTPSNRRPAMVRNDGAKLARGRFIHFLDDDDVLVPGALAALMRLADASTPHRAMVFGQVEPFGDNPQVLLAQRAHFSWAIRIASRLKYRWQLAASLVYCPAVLINSRLRYQHPGVRRRRLLVADGLARGICPPGPGCCQIPHRGALTDARSGARRPQAA